MGMIGTYNYMPAKTRIPGQAPTEMAMSDKPEVIKMLSEAVAIGKRGMMYHGHMMQMVHEMGLQGHKRLHRVNVRKDSEYMMHVQNYAIDMFGINADSTMEPWPINSDLDIKGYLEDYLAYESDVTARISNLNNRLIIAEYVTEARLVSKDLECVRKETEKVRRMLQQYEMSGWDMTYILMHDKQLHEKMKEIEGE